MRSPLVCRMVGKRGGHATPQAPGQPVLVANLRGITISSQMSKLEPTPFYALATPIYKGVLWGPCPVGGMQGVSLQEVVRTVHMRLDLARLQCRLVNGLTTDLLGVTSCPPSRTPYTRDLTIFYISTLSMLFDVCDQSCWQSCVTPVEIRVDVLALCSPVF